MHKEIEMDPKMKKCIEDTSKCYQSCVMTVAHCLEMGGDHVEPKHISLLKDCVEICKLNENFILRDSEHIMHVCDECVEICNACAESCEKIDPKDKQMMECARICRECAKSCATLMA